MPQISPDMAIKLLHTQRGNVEEGDEPDSTVKEIMKLASQLEKEKKESYSRRNLLKNFGPLIDEITKRVKGSKEKTDLTAMFDKLSEIQKVITDSQISSETQLPDAMISTFSSRMNNASQSSADKIIDSQKAIAAQSNSHLKNSFNDSIAKSKDWIVEKTTNAIHGIGKSLTNARDWIINKFSNMTPKWANKLVIAPIKFIIGGMMKLTMGVGQILFRLALSTFKIIFSIISFLVSGVLVPIISFLVTGVLLPIFSFLATTVVLPLMGIIGTVLSAVIGGVATILTAIMPILLPILAIAALIFLAVYLISSSFRGWVDEAVGKVWNWLKENVWGWLSNFASHISEWWASLWQPHSGFWAWLGSNLWNWWTEASQAIGGLVVDGLLRLGEWAWAFIEYLADGAVRLWNYLKDVPYLGSALQWLEDFFVDAWEGFVAAFGWVKDNILTPLWNLVEPFVMWIKEKIGQLLDWVFGLLPEEMKADYDTARARGSGRIGAAAHAGAAYFDLAFSSSSYMKETLGMENPPDAMSIKRMHTQQRALEAIIQNILQFHDDPTHIVNRAIANAGAVNNYGEGPPAFSRGELANMVQGMYDQIVSGGLDLSFYEGVIDPEWNRTAHVGSLFDIVFNPENEDKELTGFMNKWWSSTKAAVNAMKEITGRNDVIPYDFLTEAWGHEQVRNAMQDVWQAADGMIVRVAEAGDDEAIIPLNERGIEFMRGTLQAALERVDLPPVDLSDTEHRNLDAKFDEIKEAIAGMGKGLAAGIGKMRASSGNGDADKTKMDEQLQVNKILARGKLSGNGGRI